MYYCTASKKKRNYILDQTNVYPSARRRKMKNFKGFIRRAAVMVPDDPELKRRSDKRTFEDGEFMDNKLSKHKKRECFLYLPILHHLRLFESSLYSYQ